MGRGSRGGGGGGSRGRSRSGGGGGFRSSRGGSSFSSGRTSFGSGFGSNRSFGNPPPMSGGYRGGYHNAPPPPPHGAYHNNRYYGGTRTRTVYRSGGGCGNGCISSIVLLIFVIVLFSILTRSCGFGGLDTQINEEIVYEECKEYYEKNFSDRGDVFLFYIAYSEDLDEEYDYIWYGADCARYCDDTYYTFFELYDEYYQDDVGLQLAAAIEDYIDVVKNESDNKVDGKSFKSKCYDDKLDFIDNGNALSEAAEKLYKETGIQFFVVADQYDKMDGAKTDNKPIIITVICCVTGLIAIKLGIDFWKKKKEQKNKEVEQQIKILNTPLEEFGADPNDIDNLAKKYDNDSSSDS